MNHIVDTCPLTLISMKRMMTQSYDWNIQRLQQSGNNLYDNRQFALATGILTLSFRGRVPLNVGPPISALSPRTQSLVTAHKLK